MICGNFYILQPLNIFVRICENHARTHARTHTRTYAYTHTCTHLHMLMHLENQFQWNTTCTCTFYLLSLICIYLSVSKLPALMLARTWNSLKGLGKLITMETSETDHSHSNPGLNLFLQYQYSFLFSFMFKIVYFTDTFIQKGIWNKADYKPGIKALRYLTIIQVNWTETRVR